MPCNLLVILGPTASGKTRLGVELARRFGGEIISADSRQVYRGMDIGTGKDLAEYGEVPYHLIDIVDPGFEFNVFQFQRRFEKAYNQVLAREKLPVLVGGTGMYLESVLKGYRLVEVPENTQLRRELASLSHEMLMERLQKANPRLHNSTDLLDRSRLVRAIEIGEFQTPEQTPFLPGLAPLILGIRWDRPVLRQRITERLKQRLEQGMIQEVERLRDEGIPWKTLEFYGLEYRFIARFLQGELNRNDLFQQLNSAIHDFAKRQCTWFSRMERNGVAIHWLDGAADPLAEAQDIVTRHLPQSAAPTQP
jgi:tRNA dimethylallyltransferase